jgi:beta-galactosidase GanA
MDSASAKALRDYVSGGGTVLMTALSAKVDEHAQWFETPLPGRLNDVFGLKTNEFYEVESAAQLRIGWRIHQQRRTLVRSTRSFNGHGALAIYQYARSFSGCHDQ